MPGNHPTVGYLDARRLNARTGTYSVTPMKIGGQIGLSEHDASDQIKMG